MARMTRTIISIPEDEKKWLDTYGKRHKISSAEVVRLAVRKFRRQEAGGGPDGVLRRTAGSWKSIRGETGEYDNDLRAEWERAFGTNAEAIAVKEGRSHYGSPLPPEITDPEELRRRAIAAAGRFESGVSDLSTGHDRYLTEDRAEDSTGNDSREKREGRKGGGSR